MRKTNPSEWLLARFVGRDPAAVLHGDLTEMAATRGRAWFFAAYARTLTSLCWRPFLAFLAGAVVTSAFLYAQLPIMLGHIFLSISHPHMGLPLDVVIPDLWFVVPFAVVLYGIQDRVVQLALAMLLATSGVFYLGLWLNFDPVPAECMACGLLVAACLVAPTPRRASLIPLASICVLGFAASEGLDRIQWIADLDYRNPIWWVLVLVNMSMVAIVFSCLHSWIHRRFNRPQLAGATHA